MSAINRIVKNTWILYLRMVFTVFISLYATRITLNALGIADFGLFNLVAGVISMLTFLNTAMASATQRFMSYAEGAGDKNRQKEIFNVSIILHIIIAVLVFFVLEVIGYFLFDQVLRIPIERLETAKIILQFMVISTVFAIISVPYDAVINAHENMLFYAILGVIEAISKLGIALLLSVVLADKLIVFGLLTTTLSIILLVIRRIYCHKYYEECKIDFKKYYNEKTFKEISSFAGWSFFGSSSSLIANYGQGIVLNIFFGSIVNAAQAIANQVSGQLGVFSGTMLKALNPLIAKSEGAGNRFMMIKASLIGTKMSFFLLLIFYIPIFIEMPFVFQLWLKKIPDFTIIFCRLLLIRNLIEQMYITLVNSISAVGEIRNFQLFKSFLAVLPLGIVYILFRYNMPAYTIYQVFIIYAIIDGGITVYFAKKHCNLSVIFYAKSVIYPCFITLLVASVLTLIPFYFMKEGILRLIVISIVSLISLINAIWWLGVTDSERAIIIGFYSLIKEKIKVIYVKLLFI